MSLDISTLKRAIVPAIAIGGAALAGQGFYAAGSSDSALSRTDEIKGMLPEFDDIVGSLRTARHIEYGSALAGVGAAGLGVLSLASHGGRFAKPLGMAAAALGGIGALGLVGGTLLEGRAADRLETFTTNYVGAATGGDSNAPMAATPADGGGVEPSGYTPISDPTTAEMADQMRSLIDVDGSDVVDATDLDYSTRIPRLNQFTTMIDDATTGGTRSVDSAMFATDFAERWDSDGSGTLSNSEMTELQNYLATNMYPDMGPVAGPGGTVSPGAAVAPSAQLADE